MKDLLGRGLIYRAGSILLGLAALYIMTGDAHKSLYMETVFFFTHTTYYMIFHTIERRLRPKEDWEDAMEDSGVEV